MQRPMFKQLHLPEYGNIALANRISPHTNLMMDNSGINYPHGSKFQPSKSTDRLLASMEAAAREDSIGDDDDDDRKQWETSFIEKQPISSKQSVVGKSSVNSGSEVTTPSGPTVSIKLNILML